MKTGVYKIVNITNNKMYIGSSIDIDSRWYEHIRLLNLNQHDNSKFQNAWNKYGVENFKFEILEECASEKCIECEQYYLDILLFASKKDNRFNELGYNICRKANSWLGLKHSLKSRLKMSKTKKGVKLLEETKRKISKSNKGRVVSLETRIKISKARSGRKLCKEHINKIIKSQTGKFGEEARNVKLTSNDVAFIKRRLLNGEIGSGLAKEYNVSHSLISAIKNNKIWSHINPVSKNTSGCEVKYALESKKKMSECKMGDKNSRFGKPSPMKGKVLSIESRRKMSRNKKNRKLTEHDVRIIRRAYNIGIKIKKIAQRFNIAYITAYNIATGRKWRHLNG